MPINKAQTYSGTVAVADLKKMTFEPEVTEKTDGNKRWQERTGGWVVSGTFDVAGEDQAVTEIVAAGVVASKTCGQVVSALVARLKLQLGV